MELGVIPEYERGKINQRHKGDGFVVSQAQLIENHLPAGLDGSVVKLETIVAGGGQPCQNR